VQAAHDAAVENLLLAKNYVAAVADGHRPNGWNRYSYRRTGELPGGMVGNFKDFHINSEAAYLRQDEIEEELRKARPEDGVGRLGNNELVDEINRKKLDLRDCEERIQAVNLEHDVKLARVAKERDEWKARAERVEVQKGEVVKQTTELLNDTEKHLQDRKSLEDTIFQLRSVKGSGKGVLKKLESAEKNHADQSELIEEDTSRLIILTDRLVELQDELDRANARVQELEAQLREDKEIEIRRAELRELQNLIITREEQIAESNTREQDLRRRIQEYETRLSAVVIENSSEENRLLVAEINNLQDKLAQTLPLRTRENTQREVDQLNIDYDFCRAKLSCCDGSTQLGKLNAQMIVLEDEIGWLKRVITRHREELGGKIDRLEQELAEVRKQSAIAMAGGNNTSREKLIAVRDAFNMYHDEHAVDETHDDKLIHQIREMGVELAICREERDRAEADKAQLQAESEQLQDEVNDLQGANVRLENDKAQLQAENEQLEDEVNALQAEHASIDVDEMEIDNTMLQSQVAELKSQLAIATDVIAENIYKASGYEEQSAADEANTEHIARIETQVEEIARYQQQIADLEQRIVALPSDADFQDIQDQLNNSTARMVEIQAQGQTSDIGEELIRVQHEVTRLSGQEQRAKILVRERDRALQLRTKAEESWKEAQFQLQITRTERDSSMYSLFFEILRCGIDR
jgi:chromosome segregation ATPase